MKKHIPIILAAAFLAASCHKDTEHVDVLRSQVDSAVYSAGDTDSLSALFAAYGREGNSYGEMAAALELGKRLRNESRFYAQQYRHQLPPSRNTRRSFFLALQSPEPM